jgi:hypothetical protein
MDQRVLSVASSGQRLPATSTPTTLLWNSGLRAPFLACDFSERFSFDVQPRYSKNGNMGLVTHLSLPNSRFCFRGDSYDLMLLVFVTSPESRCFSTQ